MSKRIIKEKLSVGTSKKNIEVFKTLYSSKSNAGKTYGYLDVLNHPTMKDKKLFIVCTDTVANIVKNLHLPAYEKHKDRVVFITDEAGDPVQITKSISYAENSIKEVLKFVKNKANNVGAVAVDNYDNLEEMYLQQLRERSTSGKIMPYDYGTPRGKVYFYFLKPFLILDDIHFFCATDIKEEYYDDKPTGRWLSIMPFNRRKHFSEWITIDAKFEGTSKEEPNTVVEKWKGLRKPLPLGEINQITKIQEKINEMGTV